MTTVHRNCGASDTKSSSHLASYWLSLTTHAAGSYQKGLVDTSPSSVEDGGERQR